MYEELVKELRNMFRAYKATDNENCRHAKTILKAADAIEELSKKYLKAETDATNLTGWLAEEYARHLWIPVTEEPPLKVGDDGYNGYLVYANGYYEVADYTTDKFDNAPYFHVNGEYEPAVTHFMPLPEPPKEEGEDDDLMEVEHDSN